jgi:methionyl-tRNA formyltransferase
MTKSILSSFETGSVPRIPQDESQATVFPARKPEDGAIDWNQPARTILNLVRAVAAPYPGAFTRVEGEKLVVWKARITSETDSSSCPGSILRITPSHILVQCGQGVLALTSVEGTPRERLSPGCRLAH